MKQNQLNWKSWGLALLLLGTMACTEQSKNQGGASGAGTADTLASEEQDTQRLLSLSGNITETLFLWGKGEQVVATDITSTYPEEVKDLPKLGHVSQLSAEGVISMNPDKVMALQGEVKPGDQEKIEAAGIEFVALPSEKSWEGFKAFYTTIGKKLNKETEAQTLIERTKKVIDSLPETDQQVLFIYARSAGNMMVAGGNTAVSKVLNWAGASNAAAELDGYKPFTPEALVDYNPDALLFFQSGLEALGGPEAVLEMPGVAQTQAGKAKAIIAMNGAKLSGFGPRTADAIIELNQALASYVN